MEELTEVLADCTLSKWARWLVTSAGVGARETQLFLNRAFIHLPPNAQGRADSSALSLAATGSIRWRVTSRDGGFTVSSTTTGSPVSRCH